MSIDRALAFAAQLLLIGACPSVGDASSGQDASEETDRGEISSGQDGSEAPSCDELREEYREELESLFACQADDDCVFLSEADSPPVGDCTGDFNCPRAIAAASVARYLELKQHYAPLTHEACMEHCLMSGCVYVYHPPYLPFCNEAGRCDVLPPGRDAGVD